MRSWQKAWRTEESIGHSIIADNAMLDVLNKLQVGNEGDWK